MASVCAPQTYLLVCGAPEHRWTQVALPTIKPVVYQPTQLRDSPRAGPAADHWHFGPTYLSLRSAAGNHQTADDDHQLPVA